LHLAPSTAILVVEDNNGSMLSEEEIPNALIGQGDLLKVFSGAIDSIRFNCAYPQMAG
jgi:hypothetical protein